MSRKAARQQRRTSFEGSGLRRAMVVAVAAKVAAIVLVFDRSGLDAFDLPKSVASRAFEWLLIGLLAAALVRYGPRIVPRTRLHAFVAAFALVNVIAAVFAENTYVALFGERDRYLGLTFVGDMVVLYLAVAVAFRNARDWAVLLVTAGGATALSLAYAFVQFAGIDPNKWEIDPQKRPFGTLGHPDMFGHLLSVAFAVALGVALAAGPRDRSARVGGIVAAVVALAGIGVVATRGSALGVAGALAVLPFVAVRLGLIAKASLGRTAATGAVALAVVVALVLVSPLGARLRATAQGVAVQDRVVIYENALRAFVDRPILGWGPDAFAVAYPHYRQPREPALHGISRVHTSAHDWALDAAVSTGTGGLAALLALVVVAAAALWRGGLARQPAIAAPLVVGSAAYWAHGLVSPNSIGLAWFPWLAFGAAAAIAGTRPAEEGWRPPFGIPSYGLPAAAMAVALLLAYPVATANRDALAAEVGLNAGNAAVATARAEAAVAADGGRARYWSILGAARQRGGLWRAAADAHTEATRRATHMQSFWVNLASARAGQAVTGDDRANARAGAFEAARRAVAVDPNEPVPHWTLARVAAEFDDLDLAQAEIARAMALWPHDHQYDDTAAAIAAKNAAPQAALAFLEGLLVYKDTSILRHAIEQAAQRAGERR